MQNIKPQDNEFNKLMNEVRQSGSPWGTEGDQGGKWGEGATYSSALFFIRKSNSFIEKRMVGHSPADNNMIVDHY